jgi:DNA-binding response OmpR family regulator
MAKILVVEDNVDLNRAYQMILEKEGHDVTVAFNGKEGLEKLASKKQEIILLDLLMPKMNGIDFLKNLKGKHKSQKATVIVLSNLKEDGEVEQALKLGAYKYILKANTSPRELATHVNHLISKL